MTQPFIVFSLPRSRSTWLSLFLSYDGREIGHDIGADCATVADFFTLLGDGTCETGAAFAWPVIRRLNPHIKFAVVRRDPYEVNASLERFGITGQLIEMQKRSDLLEDIADLPGTLTVTHEDLAKPNVCGALFEHCLGEPFDHGWWQRLDPLNIQVDMPKQLAKLARNADRIAGLKAEVEYRRVHERV